MEHPLTNFVGQLYVEACGDMWQISHPDCTRFDGPFSRKANATRELNYLRRVVAETNAEAAGILGDQIKAFAATVKKNSEGVVK